MNFPKPEQEKGTPSTLHGKSGLPWDLKIVLLWTALCIVSIYTPVINQSFLRLILALPLILFIPGYVLMAAFIVGAVRWRRAGAPTDTQGGE